MFSLTTLFSIWPFRTASSLETDPPSYNDALLAGGCRFSGSFSAFSDISFFAQLSDQQKSPNDRIKAMFTATEATFWLISQHPHIDNGLARKCVHILGSLARECYSFMKISADDELARSEWTYKLQKSFSRWQMFLSEYLSICYSINNRLRALQEIRCYNINVYQTIQALHQEGFAEMELFLDRAYTLVLYGGAKEARAGFPVPKNIACSVHEGARRRRVRRLLNSAGFAAPEWKELDCSSQAGCLECPGAVEVHEAIRNERHRHEDLISSEQDVTELS